MKQRVGMDASQQDEDFRDVTCPACGSIRVELQSLFGGSASELLFYCNGCRSCFSWLKWRHALPPSPGRTGPADAGRRENAQNRL